MTGNCTCASGISKASFLSRNFNFPDLILLLLLLAGLVLLPFVWAINVVWFFNDAFRKPVFDEQSQIKKCE